MEFINKALDWFFSIFERASGIFSIAPYDILFIAFLFIFLLGFGFQYGKNRIFTLVFSLYFAAFISLQFPYTDILLGSRVGDIELTAIIVGLVFVFFIVIYVVFNRITTVIFPTNSARRWLEAAILATVTTALILALSYHVLPIQTIHDFSDPIDRLFASDESFFWWLIAPLVALLVTGKQEE